LGSVRSVTGTNANLQNLYAYEAFGAHFISSTTEGVMQRYVYTGREKNTFVDAPMHFRHRHYSISTGRFNARDPLGYLDGENIYSYVYSNPIVNFDPYGLCGFSTTNWGEGDTSRGNCYRYAIDMPIDPAKTLKAFIDRFEKFPEKKALKKNFMIIAGAKISAAPGQTPMHQRFKNCKELVAAVLKDGFTASERDADCGKCEYKFIAVWGFPMDDKAGTFDFHFARQNSDGSWSDKRGLKYPVRQIKGDIEESMIGTGYTDICGYFCAPYRSGNSKNPKSVDFGFPTGDVNTDEVLKKWLLWTEGPNKTNAPSVEGATQ
jgi:RHS repeat-associated protein